VLHGRYNFHGELGNGQFRATIPENFKRGSICMRKAATRLRQRIFVHEIGHVLGLFHAASNNPVMFRARMAHATDSVDQVVEQDAANLRALWGPPSTGVFSINGKISTAYQHKLVFVFAGKAINGHT
jgi:hypothetical protein